MQRHRLWLGLVFGVWGLALLAALGLMGAMGRRPAGGPLAGVPPVQAAGDEAAPAATPAGRPTALATPAGHIPALPPTASPRPSRTASAVPPPTATPGNPLVIGHSAAGRPLEVFRFGDGPIERLVVAGIHGGYEWNTIALADELIAYLEDHPDFIPPEVTLYILRSLNPDGEARARGVDGRVNDNGVDLNRNWPAHWQADWPRAGCWQYRPVTGGARPASEPETRALMDFIRGSRVDALISYHSAVLGIFPGGQPPDPDSLRLAEAVAAVSTYPYPPIDTGCQFTGQLIDWASARGIAALDVELTNHRDTDFEQNLAILAVLLAWRP